MDNRLRQLFRNITYKHRSVLQNHLGQYDLYVGQPRYLKYIKKYPGITQKELVEHLNLAKETVSVTLTKLENSGYLERIVNPKDRREKNLYLTDKGNQTILKLSEYFESVENAMFASLSESQKIELELYFKIILEELAKGKMNEEIL